MGFGFVSNPSWCLVSGHIGLDLHVKDVSDCMI